MDTASETFSRFLTALAASLEQPASDTAELARTMHLSRFHLDRIVSATAGEPPGRFRRRILLERAAHRLATTDAGVLEAAVEAGYSSNEAFTRAFRSAYETTPSAWRRRPGSILLPTPNGVHFHPPGGLVLPARTKVTAMDLVTTMIEHHVHLVAQMVDRAGSLDGADLDRPIEISVPGIDPDPTIRSLLSRLVGQLEMWNCAVENRPYDFSLEQDEDLVSMRRRLAEQGAVFMSRTKDVVAQEQMEETFVDATDEPPQAFTYGAMIAHVLTYAAHRRTLVTGALSAVGIDIEDDPLRWEPLEP